MVSPKVVLIDYDIPESIITDIQEPALTSQLLDLDRQTLSFYESGTISVL